MIALAMPTGIIGLNQDSGRAIFNEFGNGRNLCRHHRDPCGHGLDEHIGDAVPVSVSRHLGCQRKTVGLTIVVDDFPVGKRPQQIHPVLRSRSRTILVSCGCISPLPMWVNRKSRPA